MIKYEEQSLKLREKQLFVNLLELSSKIVNSGRVPNKYERKILHLTDEEFVKTMVINWRSEESEESYILYILSQNNAVKDYSMATPLDVLRMAYFKNLI